MATSMQMNSNRQQFDPTFPFGNEVFLSSEPMTDAEFSNYILSDNSEVPIEQVDFTDQHGM
ncbi:MAG: hypothetical protein Q7J38_04035 [Gallionella sp.]|nr:hypothetical protein [Gallionella sp.]